MSEQRARTHLVVVGSSAGGIEALSTLVAELDGDFPAPIVLAQHLDPSRVSHLGEILARKSKLPVRTVEDRMHLDDGVVYVVPANRHVGISDHELWLRESENGRSMPSIDLLFSTAAHVFGENLIAVVLTGTGSDGSAGALKVKEMGGTVVIQDPRTAWFGSMPRSLAPSTVDIIADLENIGTVLKDLLKREGRPPPDDEVLLPDFLAKIRAHSGIDFSSYKLPTIQRRLQRRMAATGWARLQDYVAFAERTPAEYQRLISSFLIKVTEFFRDSELFAYLQATLLPKLIQEARDHDNELRLWSAGCSTGEEAYTLAIQVCEILGDELERLSVRIFATDLDPEAVAFARRGVYATGSLSNLPDHLIDRYFTRVDDSFELNKRVRSLVVFGEHDLGQRAPFPRIDLVLCRNVLIYFVPELQKRALELFAFSIRNNGFLVLGKAETPALTPGMFHHAHPQLKIYQRTGEIRLPLSSRPETASLPVQRLHVQRPFASASSEPRGRLDGGSGAIALQSELLNDIPAGVLIVNRQYDIEAINILARRYFNIETEAVGEDFLHLLGNVPTKPLRALIDAVLRGETPGPLEEFQVDVRALGETRYLQVLPSPRQPVTDNGAVTAAVLLVNDVTAIVTQRRAAEEAQSRAEKERAAVDRERQQLADRHEALIADLKASNRELLSANELLTNVIMTLRGTNEEFLLGSEEAQAASEEMETLNEELQATNEELETLNEELQATVEELNTTNEDLAARGTELLQISESLEAQRGRLSTILTNMGEAVLVLDQNGQTVLVSEMFNRMFPVTGINFAPEDEEGRPLPASESPQARAARGESFQIEFMLTDPEGNRHWLEARGQPVNQGSSAGDSVIVIRDVTDRGLLQLQDEFMAVASHELRTPLTALQGYLEMMMRRADSTLSAEQVKTYAANALGQTKRLGMLVSDLTDASRHRTGKLSLSSEPVDLVMLVRRVIDVTEHAMNGRAIHADIPSEAIVVMGDPGRLEQVVLNLLTNAQTYAPHASTIDVSVKRVNNQGEVTVHDNGPGVPEEHRESIFKRFYQIARDDHYHNGGLGLGLYIVRAIVTEHGGTVDFSSEVGSGTTFFVRLPLANPEAQGADQDPGTARQP